MVIRREEPSPEEVPAETLLSEFIAPSAAKRLIAEYGSIYHILLHTSEQQLAGTTGIGKAGVKRLACIKAVIRRLETERKQQLRKLSGPEEVALYCADMQDLQQEEIRVLFLNTKNKILGQKRIFLGTVNASLVSAREIFHAAVQHMAAHIILVHNHPSGDPTPSEEDKESTKRMVQAGEVLNIPVLDHMIIGRNGYCSLREAGYLEAR
jgi:DNA repair protein RadC